MNHPSGSQRCPRPVNRDTGNRAEQIAMCIILALWRYSGRRVPGRLSPINYILPIEDAATGNKRVTALDWLSDIAGEWGIRRL